MPQSLNDFFAHPKNYIGFFLVLIVLLLWIDLKRKHLINHFQPFHLYASLFLAALQWVLIGYFGSATPGIIVAFAINVILILLGAKIHRRQEWPAKHFLLTAITLVITTAIYGAVISVLLPANFVGFISDATPYFFTGVGVFSGLWTIFGIWMNIHTIRARQGRAMNYDNVLLNIIRLLDRTMDDSALGRQLRTGEEESQIAETYEVKMVLFTPSNGNVSCLDPSVYEEYREKMLKAAEEARLKRISMTIVSLSNQAIRKYYKQYENDHVTDSDTAKKACAEALCFFEMLRTKSCETKETGFFRLITKESMEELLPQHLISSKREAWLWVPYKKRPRKLAGTGYSDEELGLTSDITNDQMIESIRRRWRQSADEHRYDGLDCIAFRTEDMVVKHEVDSWINEVGGIPDDDQEDIRNHQEAEPNERTVIVEGEAEPDAASERPRDTSKTARG